MTTIERKIVNLTHELQKRVEAGNEIEEIMENAEQITPDMESAFDTAYAEEYTVRQQLARAIVEYTAPHEQLDMDTAIKLTYKPYFTELVNELK